MKIYNQIKLAQELIRFPTVKTEDKGIMNFLSKKLSSIGFKCKIVNRKTGEITYGKIPPYSVVVPGSLPDKNNPSAPSLYCAVIIKQVDEKTRSKTSINDLLRE